MSEDRQLEREEQLQESLLQNNVASIRAMVPKEKMGYSRCVMCVEIEEKRAKQYGRTS